LALAPADAEAEGTLLVAEPDVEAPALVESVVDALPLMEALPIANGSLAPLMLEDELLRVVACDLLMAVTVEQSLRSELLLLDAPPEAAARQVKVTVSPAVRLLRLAMALPCTGTVKLWSAADAVAPWEARTVIVFEL